MNCSNCQNPIADGEKFCGSCGKENVNNSIKVISENFFEKNKNGLRIIAKASIISNILAVFVLLFNLYMDLSYFYMVLSAPEDIGGISLYRVVITIVWPVAFVLLVFAARAKFKAEKYVFSMALSQIANIQMYVAIKDLIWLGLIMFAFFGAY